MKGKWRQSVRLQAVSFALREVGLRDHRYLINCTSRAALPSIRARADFGSLLCKIFILRCGYG